MSSASNAALLVDLVEAMTGLPPGGTAEIPVSSAADAELVEAWCRRSGNHVLKRGTGWMQIARSSERNPLLEIPPDRRPGARLWLYANFDCNLACDYCCVRSSPRTPRRALDTDLVKQIVSEAPAAGVSEIFVTGGEPFLLPRIGEIVEASAKALPTTVLTNGMLFAGRRLAILRSLSRERVALQISLDSPDATLHDRHRGSGSWDRAVEGIRIALAEGFRVRVAATLGSRDLDQEAAFHAFLDRVGIAQSDRVVRRVARRGLAEDGVAISAATLIPEVTIAADGVYWHPVGADDEDMRVTGEILPLVQAIDAVIQRFVEYRQRQDQTADLFPCA